MVKVEHSCHWPEWDIMQSPANQQPPAAGEHSLIVSCKITIHIYTNIIFQLRPLKSFTYSVHIFILNLLSITKKFKTIHMLQLINFNQYSVHF